MMFVENGIGNGKLPKPHSSGTASFSVTWVTTSGQWSAYDMYSLFIKWVSFKALSVW
jgi:hypothetical protein